MKFLSIYKHAERNTPPTEQEMATMGKLVEQGFKEGWLLATEGCLPSKLGARVRRSGSSISVTDGPFAETREQLGGYFLVDARDLDEAIGIAARIPMARKGTVEVRPVIEIPGLPN